MPDNFERDPGLQPERTALAWGRTAMLLLLNALLAIRAGWVQHKSPMPLLGVALLLAAAVLFAYGTLRKKTLIHTQTPGASSPTAILALSSLCALVCMVETVQVLARIMHY